MQREFCVSHRTPCGGAAHDTPRRRVVGHNGCLRRRSGHPTQRFVHHAIRTTRHLALGLVPSDIDRVIVPRVQPQSHDCRTAHPDYVLLISYDVTSLEPSIAIDPSSLVCTSDSP